MHNEIETYYHFILPVRVSPLVKKLKQEVIESIKPSYSGISPSIKTFDPILPRKYLTVQINGTWKQILEVRAKVFNEIRKNLGEELENFIYFVHAQMYRHIFKNSAKFVHGIEKMLTPSYFPNYDGKKVYILKFWDVYSAEVLLEGKENCLVEGFRNKIMNLFFQDSDTLINLVRLCDNESQVKFLLETRFKLTFDETLKKMYLFFLNFSKDFDI